MLFFAGLADCCHRQVEKTQAALTRSIECLEGLATEVLPEREAAELLASCACFRESSAMVASEVGPISLMVESGDLAPHEAVVVEHELKGLLRQLQELSETVAGLSTLVAGRIQSSA